LTTKQLKAEIRDLQRDIDILGKTPNPTEKQLKDRTKKVEKLELLTRGKGMSLDDVEIDGEEDEPHPNLLENAVIRKTSNSNSDKDVPVSNSSSSSNFQSTTRVSSNSSPPSSPGFVKKENLEEDETKYDI